MNLRAMCGEFRKVRGKTIVGLTGAAASGKSAALAAFKKRGAFCLSTDALAKEVLTSGACYRRISRSFGPGVILKDGSVDRKELARQVFSDKSKRKLLEDILHPRILGLALASIKKSHEKVIIVEVPLLFEAGLEKCFALTVCVDAPRGQRLRRAAARGWSAAELRRRDAAQLTAGEKAARADVVLGNDGTLGELREKAGWLYAALKKAGQGEKRNGKRRG